MEEEGRKEEREKKMGNGERGRRWGRRGRGRKRKGLGAAVLRGGA